MSPSLNIWDTHWKVRSKPLQRNDCWNEGAGYQRRPGIKANNDPRENWEQWNDPWSFLAFSSTPGKRVAHQLHWRISKQIAQLSLCFSVSENTTESCEVNVSSLVSGVLYFSFGCYRHSYPNLQDYMRAKCVPGIQFFAALVGPILSQPPLLCRNGFKFIISFASKTKPTQNTLSRN